MKILIDKSPSAITELSERFDFEFWQLRTPLTRNRVGQVPYGLDNGCFSGELHPSWDRLVREAYDRPPIFVTLPDLVGSARRTLDLFDYFSARLNGLPKALVLQDGIGQHPIPWREIQAVFVGGSDAFKISTEAFDAARCAKMLGKWVHVGRVNDLQRLRNWMGFADSIDGSGISQYDHQLKACVDFVCGNGALANQKSIDFGSFAS